MLKFGVSISKLLMSDYTARISANDIHIVVCHVMSRHMVVRVPMVSVRSYRNIILILTVIITSNPTLLALFDRYSF
jgi:hypothetical protein